MAGGIALSLGACGGGDDDGGQGGGADAGVAGPDAADGPRFPTVNVSPSNGELGVLADDPLILTFSEAMDRASVEAAWTSESLPRESMVFSWNATNTILTVDASAVIEHPNGGPDVDRFDYDIVISDSAFSEAGEAIENTFTSSFASARDVTLQLVRVDATTGGHNGSAYLADIRVGDDSSNQTYRGFITVDLSALPTVVEITEASVFARQTDTEGFPYLDLGDIHLLHLDPLTSEIAFNDFTGAGTDLGVFSDSAAQANPGGNRSLDVTAAFAQDVADGATVSSYRLEFDIAQEGNDIDHAIFDRTSVRLDVRLLAE